MSSLSSLVLTSVPLYQSADPSWKNEGSGEVHGTHDILDVGDAFRGQNVSSPGAPHHPLGQVNSLQTHQPFQSCSGDSGVTFLSALWEQDEPSQALHRQRSEGGGARMTSAGGLKTHECVQQIL